MEIVRNSIGYVFLNFNCATMKYKKDQLDKRYRRIAYLKIAQGYTNAQISSMMPNCKKRTIESAIKYVRETPISDASLVQERIEQLDDKAYDLCLMREVYREQMKALYAKDLINNPEIYKEYNKTLDKFIPILRKIMKIENQIYTLQGLFDRPREKQKFIQQPNVTTTVSEVMMIKNADGTFYTVPITDKDSS